MKCRCYIALYEGKLILCVEQIRLPLFFFVFGYYYRRMKQNDAEVFFSFLSIVFIFYDVSHA
jgi:hypothetical protein